MEGVSPLNESADTTTELHEDLRASYSRELQLWFLTLGQLVIFALGSIAAAYLLFKHGIEDGGFRNLVLRLLTGLALLTALFCMYVVQARISVSKFNLFLNEMSGMATGNRELEDCLDSIVKGMARTCGAQFARFLILRPADNAVEVLATWSRDAGESPPPKGYSHALDELPRFASVARSGQPAVIENDTLQNLSHDDVERRLLTGDTPALDCFLVLPVPGRARMLGLLVIGRERAWWQRPNAPHEISNSLLLAGHAGRVVEQAIRRREAVRDPLTGLYNRRHFHERIEAEIGRAARDNTSLALLLCDLDGFKQVNDTSGHAAGDEVLKLAASSVASTTRGTDLHFRWGGDEFVVVLSNTAGDGYLRAARRMRERIRQGARERKLDVDMSIGVALYPDHATDPEELLRIADLAMYVAKKSGDKIHVGYETYTLGENCVKFVFQPIRDSRTGEVSGQEILTRDPDGRLSPLELFEKYRAVGQLDSLKRLIFDRQLRRVADTGIKRLFVNADTDFLTATAPPPRPPGIEVVLEIAGFDAGPPKDSQMVAISQWRAAGYRLAVTGFGIAFTSPHLLDSLRPDYLKVDRRSIVKATGSRRHHEVLGHLLKAARSVTTAGVIAEGIETSAELELVRSLDIELAQGYLLGRPSERMSSSAAVSGFPRAC
jgi:diguanylate cyclase (GGDEF)-like protein